MVEKKGRGSRPARSALNALFWELRDAAKANGRDPQAVEQRAKNLVTLATSAKVLFSLAKEQKPEEPDPDRETEEADDAAVRAEIERRLDGIRAAGFAELAAGDGAGGPAEDSE
jgi:hypothetical protein